MAASCVGADVTVRASVGPNGDPKVGGGNDPSISADGRYVAFEAPDRLLPGDANGEYDVYVRDLVAGTTTRASVDHDEGDTDHESENSSVSPDGRYVAFESHARDLLFTQGDRGLDVFVVRLS